MKTQVKQLAFDLFERMGIGEKEISKHLFKLTLEKALGRPLSKDDEAIFEGCVTIKDFISRLLQSNIINAIFLQDFVGRARLGEFYVALCANAQLAKPNQECFDCYTVSEQGKKLRTRMIQVKTSYAPRRRDWVFNLTNKKQETGYDVLILIGYVDEFNPLDAAIFVIPEADLRPIIEREIDKGISGEIPITIAKQRRFRGVGKLNKWYEYQVVDHTKIKHIVEEHRQGDLIVLLNSERSLASVQKDEEGEDEA